MLNIHCSIRSLFIAVIFIGCGLRYSTAPPPTAPHKTTIQVDQFFNNTDLGPANLSQTFTNKSFSFYADFPNEQNLSTVQEDLEKKIFDQILIDIFNATVANW